MYVFGTQKRYLAIESPESLQRITVQATTPSPSSLMHRRGACCAVALSNPLFAAPQRATVVETRLVRGTASDTRLRQDPCDPMQDGDECTFPGFEGTRAVGQTCLPPKVCALNISWCAERQE